MGVPGNANALLLRSTAAAGGYQVSRSLRFSSGDSSYLSRTPGSAGNQQTWTLSMWVKRSKLGSTYRLFDAYTSASDTGYTLFGFSNEDKLIISGWSNNWKITTQVFRDVSAWYHIVVAFDVTQATGSNRIKFYVNGAQITTFDTDVAPAQNTNHAVNGAIAHAIGRYSPGPSQYFDGYLADIHFIDGQALTPSSFAETDSTTGQWIPKLYTGSYGTNGFKLTFADNSAATAAALGKDSAGSNNWTPTNFSVVNTAIYSGLASGSPDTGAYKPSNMWTAAGASNTSNTQTTGTTSASGGYGNSVYFNLSSNPISATSAQLWILKDNNVGSYAAKIEINGTDITPSVLTTGYSWVGVTGITSVTSIRIPYGAYCGAIRFNGVTFVEGQTTDSLVDTPTSYNTDTGVGGEVRGNYCTWNPLCRSSAYATISNGNLDLAVTTNDYGYSGTLFVPNSGKWYFEVTLSATSGNGPAIGIVSAKAEASDMFDGSYASGLEYGGPVYAYNPGQGTKMSQSASTSYVTAASPSANDVFMVAVDFDNGAIYFGKNGTWLNSGVPTSGASKTGAAFTSIDAESYAPVIHAWGTGITGVLNAGQRAFAYTAPSGFKCLSDTSLPTPVVAKPSTVMDVKLFSGNGSTQNITGFAFSPDFAWFKRRSSAFSHELFDVIRGGSNVLFSDLTSAEANNAALVTSFNSDGVSVGSALGANGSGVTSVMWAWDAGTSTVTNTQGSITSSVRANASAGFSIVTYTGAGSAGSTVGHGGLINLTNGMIIIKQRNSASNWWVGHGSQGWTKAFEGLNTTAAISTTSAAWNNTAPSSTVFTLGTETNMNGSGNTYVAYCFAPVAGYSAMGSFVANGSSDGPFVYTGFRPRWILMKQNVAGEAWTMYDTARDTYNVAGLTLFANYSNAETDYKSYTPLDILSNGFKLRTSNITWNTNGATVIYAAFAESPFQYARAR